MNVIIFGASGMVGQGVLRECLSSPSVENVLAISRSSCAVDHMKLQEILHTDFFDYSSIEEEITGWNACFFCLGVSAAGKSEKEYERLTYTLTIGAAETLARLNPQMTFCYVSGAGTDSSERGRVMWARVKGRTENQLLRLPFKAAFMFRPGYIQPAKGVRSKTPLYRAFYAIAAPLYPLLKRLFPNYLTTTSEVGRAMISAALRGHESALVEIRDIKALAGRNT